jgi:hydroxymethylpyrimidine pyrophosphatase-like HAD family hydrolase
VRYLVLACDYDGTLAHAGRVDQETLAALEHVRASGRRLVLVTGRRLEDLMQVFPRLDLFDRVVVENGALLYRPATREEAVLCEPPPPDLVAGLQARGVRPLEVGRTIVATWSPHETTVFDVIRELGLEQHVIFNKGAVMILPSGINKATGLAVALDELGLSAHNAVGVGDAENDHAFLAQCECAVAVANAIPRLKERADWVTAGDHGAGVVELIGRLVDQDLADLEPRLGRHEIPLGVQAVGTEVRVPSYGTNVLVAGTSGSGKSTFATAFLERLSLARRQFCIIDPEGDYPSLEGAVVLGDKKSAPRVEEVLDVLARPSQNVVVNLLGVSLEHRPAFFDGLLPRLQELRTRTGRPHWIIVDETHHLLPSSWDPSTLTVPQRLQGLLLVTVHPDQVSEAILTSVGLIVAIGRTPEETIRLFTETLGQAAPTMARQNLEPGEAIGWWRRVGSEPFWFRSLAPQAERRRHVRKYAEGELRPEKSFYFRGPEGKLNLRAQNLMLFLQLADGVDAETWLYHLRQGHYSAWFRSAIKDEGLAAAAAEVEAMRDVSPEETRRRIREAIEERYTAPA